MDKKLGNPQEVLTTRAMALLMLGALKRQWPTRPRRSESSPAPRTSPEATDRPGRAPARSPAARLARRDRAIAPGRSAAGADLQAAITGLDRLARTNPEETVRASLALAVILAGVGRHEAAIAAADRALAVSPFSPRGFLIRARRRVFAGDFEGARDDIRRGLAIQLNEPGLLELRGILQAQVGDHEGAQGDFNLAIVAGAVDRIHLHKARSLVALGNHSAAVQEWSLALRRDPELPQAYLGRARSHIKLRQWDMALADLEQAASWAHSDPRLELGIVFSYFQCLGERPDRQSALRVSRMAHRRRSMARTGQRTDAIGSLSRPADALRSGRALFRRVGTAHRG